MNAEMAGELVAPYIEKRWPADRKEIWGILRLGVNKAWQEGKWLGMAVEGYVPILKDADGQNYIMPPKEYPILLAMNTHKMGVIIRDQYFMFHRNSRGDVRSNTECSWSQDIYDLGYSPVKDRNNIIKTGVMVGIRSIGPAGANEKVWINGSYADGNQVYTYKKSTYGETPCGCQVKTDAIDTIKGVELAISTSFNYICNLKFSAISSIVKTVTQSPVEIVVIDSFGNGTPVARLEPNERESKYRKYLVPNHLCDRKSLHGMFKISQQEEITSGTDNIIIKNQEALISLAKGIYAMYNQDNPEKGASYIIQAISVLDKEKTEESSPDTFPMQVQSIYEGDLPMTLQYLS